MVAGCQLLVEGGEWLRVAGVSGELKYGDSGLCPE
jgi:hypothetical protein